MIRPYRESDRAWAERVLNERFGGRLQARRGELVDVLALPGLVAERSGRPVGLLTYRREDGECELAFIAALERHGGVGTALLDALRREVADCERIWLVTTNDNLEALRFYQRRGFVLCSLRPGAVDDSRRRLKAQISSVGEFGIPIRDELELELRLGERRAVARQNEQGRAYWFLGSLFVFYLTGEETDARFTLHETLAPAGDLPPLHVHRRGDQTWYVLEGELTVYLPGKTMRCGSGDWAYGPINVPHTHRVTSDRPAKILEVNSPAGFDRFVAAVGDVARELVLPPPSKPPPDLGRIASVAAEYGIEVLGPPGTLP